MFEDAGARVADASRPRPEHQWCFDPLHATRHELARTPRLERWAELLIIESTNQFVADDATYGRVVADLAQLATLDAGRWRVEFRPDFLPSIDLVMDDAGTEHFLSGEYSAWDCLNANYGGTPKHIFHRYVSIELSKTVDARVLASDYAALPHVQSAVPGSLFFGHSCGYPNDLCLDIDGGKFGYLGAASDESCAQIWFRLTSQADGGSAVEIRDAGHPHRFPDGGFK